MIHIQFKTRYPGCPFVTYEDNINKTSTQIVFDEDSLTASELIKTVIGKLNQTEYNQANTTLIEDFLSNYSQSNEFIDRVKWTKLKQPLREFDFKQHIYINFHSTAYNDENGCVIDKEFLGDISWLIVPLDPIDSNFIHAANMTNYTIHLLNTKSIETSSRIIDADINKSSLLNPATYKNDGIDNQYEKFEANIRSARVSARRFVIRDDEKIKQKIDKTLDTTNPVNVTIDKMIEPRVRIGKIQLTNNTRASAGTIRERLANPGKAYRFRTNPLLYEQCKKIDLHIKNVCDHTIAKHNSNHRLLERDIMRDDFDFILEKTGVKRLNGVLKFYPTNSGKIIINKIHNLKSLCFLSIMRHKKNIHITLHDLS
jgi:hypothetical protein